MLLSVATSGLELATLKIVGYQISQNRVSHNLLFWENLRFSALKKQFGQSLRHFAHKIGNQKSEDHEIRHLHHFNSTFSIDRDRLYFSRIRRSSLTWSSGRRLLRLSNWLLGQSLVLWVCWSSGLRMLCCHSESISFRSSSWRGSSLSWSSGIRVLQLWNWLLGIPLVLCVWWSSGIRMLCWHSRPRNYAESFFHSSWRISYLSWCNGSRILRLRFSLLRQRIIMFMCWSSGIRMLCYHSRPRFYTESISFRSSSWSGSSLSWCNGIRNLQLWNWLLGIPLVLFMWWSSGIRMLCCACFDIRSFREEEYGIDPLCWPWHRIFSCVSNDSIIFVGSWLIHSFGHS